MSRVIGYMVTCTAYGTWLQGDERGWVKGGEVLEGDARVVAVNRKSLKDDPVRFKRREKEIVRKCILEQAQERGDKVRAVSVFSNHVHVVVEGNHEDIKSMVRKFKAGATAALHRAGFACGKKIWTSGFDKRYCFSNEELDARVKYVLGHNK